MSDHNETDNDLPFEESLGKKDFISDAPFEGPSTGAAIGIGGGSWGTCGMRSSRRYLDEVGARTSLVRGLAWLKGQQRKDGSWEGRRRNTGLALLAYLGAGQTHKHGTWKKTVKAGLRHLKQIQADDGSFADRSQAGWYTEHAILTLVLTEAYGMTGSPLFKTSSQRGLDLLAKTEPPTSAAAAWKALAFHASTGTPLRRPADWKTAAFAALEAETPGVLPSTTRSMVAAAALARIFAGADPMGQPLRWPDWSADPVQAHFAGLALYQAGGGLWKAWRKRLPDSVMSAQISKPRDLSGSWSPTGPDAKLLGRVGMTALACLTLETGIRYTRVKPQPVAEAAPAGAR